MSGTLAKVDRANRKETERLLRALWRAPREAALQAAARTVQALVAETYHDSSNAAYNWRLQVNGKVAGYQNYKGRPPVGKRGEKRTAHGNQTAIELVALTRVQAITGQLKAHLYGRGGFLPGSWGTFTDFTLVNELESDIYEGNALLYDAVNSGRVKLAFDSGLKAAQNLWEAKV